MALSYALGRRVYQGGPTVSAKAQDEGRRAAQVNIRLSEAEYDVVQALIFLDEGRSSASEVLRTIVSDYLGTQGNDEDVRLALQALEQRRARKAGKLKQLRSQASGSPT